jgi:hypothetical protein
MMSKSYRIIECGFDTQSDANNYIDMNPNLEQSLQSSCAGKSWAIVGYCECDPGDLNCADCRNGGSLSVVCSEDVKECNNGKKTVVLSSGYSTQQEALDYLNENYESLTTQIENECPNCPRYFAGFLTPGTFFMTCTMRDWDCCYFASNKIWEGAPWKVDGHYTYTANGDCTATITEATGNYSSMLGRTANIADIHPSGLVNSTIVSNVKRLSSIRNPGCCNADGDYIYAILA